jgi:RND family efflux transporter MFP subunit
MNPRLLIFMVLAAVLAACGKGPGAGSAASEAQGPLLIAPEDLYTVRNNALSTGPSITGSLQPERRADLRAEVQAVVLQVVKENGEPVRRGDLILRLDDTAIRENLTSAEAATSSASRAYEQAERQFQRITQLRASSLVSTQDLEDAEIRRNNAQSDFEAAKTRVAVARQQLQRTEIRAPFDGIVGDRQVSAGDTVQVGRELVKVFDPTSMRFEGLVSADSIGEIKAGQTVQFRVHGYAQQEFTGHVLRVNPAANVTTRQVEVLVAFGASQQEPKLAGLYAEGRIETGSTSALTLPATALVQENTGSFAWRVQGDALRKVTLNVGPRDARTGDYVLKGGVAEGDRLLRYPNATLKDGQKVQLEAATDAASGTQVEPARSPAADSAG